LKKTKLSSIILVGFLLNTVFTVLPYVAAEDGTDTQVSAWWVEDYPGEANDLSYGLTNAWQFCSGLEDDGWTEVAIYGDDDAWESHWEEEDDEDYADDVDVAWFFGHGAPNEIQFGTDHDDDPYHNYECHASEASWGGTDMEWAILYACSCLSESYKTTWNQVFDGLHGICGFHSHVDCVSSLGDEAADEFTSGDSVYDAWVDATVSELDGSNTAAIYCVILKIDAEYYDYWDDELDDPLPDYDGIFYLKYGYSYDNWGC